MIPLSVGILLLGYACFWFFCHKHARNNSEAYISLTTTPTRIGKMQPVIDAFLQQTLKPSNILVNIPRKSSKGEPYIIPKWLRDYERQNLVQIVTPKEDYGPGTKLLGCLDIVTNPEAIIVIADDDIIHPKHWFETLVANMERYPKDAVSYTTWKYKEYTVLQGYMGAAVRRKMLTDDVRSIPDKSCCQGDDLWISAHLARKNIPIRTVVPTILKPYLILHSKNMFLTPEAKGSAPNNAANYKRCYSYL